MKLTKIDRQILASYAAMLDGLADYLGPGYEFVLHSLENLDQSVIKIINGHYSNRREGSPITDLALNMLSEIESGDNLHRFKTYFNRTRSGALLKSSTIPIQGENQRIIGLLCTNFYTSTPLSSILECFSPTIDAHTSTKETFSDNTTELIADALGKARQKILDDVSIPSTNKNKEILAILYQKGIFNLKDAVNLVANELGISKNTVYLHLRKFSNTKDM